MLEILDRDVPKMTDEQKEIYDQILAAVNQGSTGKTFSGSYFLQLLDVEETLFLTSHQVALLLYYYQEVGLLIQDLVFH